MTFLPEPFGDFHGIDVEVFPPGGFVADLVELAMMAAAERDGEFVTDFAAERSGLRKAEVVSIGRLPAADETGLDRDEFQMGLVA